MNTTNLSLGRETFIALAAKFVLALSGFVGIVIFARVLGVEGLGKYYFILAAVKIGAQVPGGVSEAIKKRISEVGTDPDEFLGLGLLVAIGFLVLVSALLLLTYPYTRQLFGPITFVYGLIAALGSLSVFSLINRSYAGIGHPGMSFWTDTARSILTLAFQVGFLLAGYHVLGLLAGFTIATLAAAAATAVLVGVVPTFPSRKTASRTVAFAKWSVPNALTQNMYSRLDVLLMAALLGSGAVGLYEPALRLTIPATFIAASVGDSLVVKASGLASLGEDVVHDLRNAISYTALFSIPLFFGAFAFPQELMGVVYGPDYAAGKWALVGLALFQVFNTLRIPYDQIVKGVDRPELQFRISAVTLVVNVVLVVPLALAYGLEGVVAATIVAEAFRVVLYKIISYRLFDEVVIPRPLLEQFASGLAMFALLLVVLDFVRVTSWVSLLFVVAVGALVYFAVLTGISSHFRLTTKNVLEEVIPPSYHPFE